MSECQSFVTNTQTELETDQYMYQHCVFHLCHADMTYDAHSALDRFSSDFLRLFQTVMIFNLPT